MSSIVIHQIFLLMRDWSKYVTFMTEYWIPQVKLGNTQDYNPSDLFTPTCDWSKHVTWPNIPQLKLGNIREYTPISKMARVVKNIWRIMNMIASIWGENMFGDLSLNITCYSKLTVFHELRSRKTVHFLEQIMSKDKYPGMFSGQREAIVYLCSKYF